jgi:hypothetical protein
LRPRLSRGAPRPRPPRGTGASRLFSASIDDQARDAAAGIGQAQQAPALTESVLPKRDRPAGRRHYAVREIVLANAPDHGGPEHRGDRDRELVTAVAAKATASGGSRQPMM